MVATAWHERSSAHRKVLAQTCSSQMVYTPSQKAIEPAMAIKLCGERCERKENGQDTSYTSIHTYDVPGSDMLLCKWPAVTFQVNLRQQEGAFTLSDLLSKPRSQVGASTFLFLDTCLHASIGSIRGKGNRFVWSC